MSAVSHVCNFVFGFSLNVSHVRDLGFHSGNEDAGLLENDVILFRRITDLRWSLPSPFSVPK